MSVYRAQKEQKPTVENAARELFDDDKLGNILDFLDFLKSNKLTPRWYTSDSAATKRKGVAKGGGIW